MGKLIQATTVLVVAFLLCAAGYSSWRAHQMEKNLVPESLEFVASDFEDDPRPDLPKEIKMNGTTVWSRDIKGSVTIGRPTVTIGEEGSYHTITIGKGSPEWTDKSK